MAKKINQTIVYSLIGLALVSMIVGFILFKSITGNIILDIDYNGTGYATPFDIFNDNTLLFSVSPEDVLNDSVNLEIDVNHSEGLIYSRGYIYNFKDKQWEVFNLNGSSVGMSSWISDSASANLNFNGSEFFRDGPNWVVTYSCKKYDKEWKCGCNSQNDCGYWMLQVVNASGLTNPVEPTCTKDLDCGPGGFCVDGICQIEIPEVPEGIPISTCEELQNIRENLSGDYYLAKDINCSDTINWNDGKGFEPIGSRECIKYNPHDIEFCDEYDSFSGTFNGQEYKILDLYINLNKTNTDHDDLYGYYYGGIGLFRSSKGEIANTFLEGSGSVSLVGTNEGLIFNSQVKGNLSGEGGISIYNGENGKIINSSFIGNITNNEIFSVGGLVGSNSGEIYNSYSIVNINANGDNSNRAGGLVGSNSGEIHNSHAFGSVKGKYLVGILVGSNRGVINKSYSMGNATSDTYVGGLVGHGGGGRINNSYSIGIVKGSSGGVGGLVGYNHNGNISNSYAVVSVSGGNLNGGLAGYIEKTPIISNSYYDKDISKKTDSNKGTPKTTVQMKQQDTYQNWDFENIWAIDPNKNGGYPYLKVFDSDDN